MRLKIPTWIAEDVPAGTARRKFHLPTHRYNHVNMYRTWIMPLAFFVVIINAFRLAFHAFWRDIVDAICEWADPDVIDRQCDYDFCSIHCHSADKRQMWERAMDRK